MLTYISAFEKVNESDLNILVGLKPKDSLLKFPRIKNTNNYLTHFNPLIAKHLPTQLQQLMCAKEQTRYALLQFYITIKYALVRCIKTMTVHRSFCC